MATTKIKPLTAYHFLDGKLRRVYTDGKYTCVVSLPWSVSAEFSVVDTKVSWLAPPRITSQLFKTLHTLREKLLVEMRRLQRQAKRCLA